MYSVPHHSQKAIASSSQMLGRPRLEAASYPLTHPRGRWPVGTPTLDMLAVLTLPPHNSPAPRPRTAGMLGAWEREQEQTDAL